MIEGGPAAFLGFGVGGAELLLVGAVALALLGPRELPRLARTVGRLLAGLRSAAQEFQDQLMNADAEPHAGSAPPPAPDEKDAPHDPAG